jgi:hypothetical protein
MKRAPRVRQNRDAKTSLIYIIDTILTGFTRKCQSHASRNVVTLGYLQNSINPENAKEESSKENRNITGGIIFR